MTYTCFFPYNLDISLSLVCFHTPFIIHHSKDMLFSFWQLISNRAPIKHEYLSKNIDYKDFIFVRFAAKVTSKIII